MLRSPLVSRTSENVFLPDASDNFWLPISEITTPRASWSGFYSHRARVHSLAPTVVATTRFPVSAAVNGRWRQRESFDA